MGEGGGRGASLWTFLRPSWVNGQGRKQFFFSAVQAGEVWLREAEAERSPRAARRRRGGGGG